ncbi:hypothetical protein RRG08_026381 [Elysia crispata]|uniref:Uncharacterized protein n=1 Tax=Elysia crispata TaxID=231223 RepID=A0AAE0XRK0_9GAST|nr:hypothetical protein RRG08_026381 [Elysia crispata]
MSIAKCDIGRIEIYDRQSRVAGDLEARQKHRRIGLSAGSRAGNGCGEKEGGVVRGKLEYQVVKTGVNHRDDLINESKIGRSVAQSSCILRGKKV